MARSTHLVAVSGTEGIGADGSACSTTGSAVVGLLVGVLAGSMLVLAFHRQFDLVSMGDMEDEREWRRIKAQWPGRRWNSNPRRRRR